MQEEANPGNMEPECPIGKIFKHDCSEKQFGKELFREERKFSETKWSHLCQMSPKITKANRLKEVVLMHVWY
jgi:hypothetical protein